MVLSLVGSKLIRFSFHGNINGKLLYSIQQKLNWLTDLYDVDDPKVNFQLRLLSVLLRPQTLAIL